MKKYTQQAGFSLIELIVYLAVASIAFAVAVNIGINLTVSHASSNAKNEVYDNARLITNQLQYQFGKSEDIVAASSVFNDDEGVIVLQQSNPAQYVYFNTYDKEIISGGQPFTIKKLRIKVGDESYIDLTSDRVNVTSFRLTNLTRGTEAATVKVEFDLESLNTSNDPKYAGSIQIETALTIKR